MRIDAEGGAKGRQQKVLVALIWVMGLDPMIFAVMYPRIWASDYFLQVQGLVAPYGLLLSGQRVAVWLMALFVLVAVVEALRKPRLRSAGTGLWLAALALVAGLYFAALWGTAGRFRLPLVIVPGAFTAIYLLDPVPLRVLVRHARLILLVYAVGSLAAILVNAEWALESPYREGLVPALPWRLHGLATHANVLAALMVTYLVLDWYEPRRTPAAWLGRSAVLTCLILTQSKTALIIVAAVVLVRQFLDLWEKRELRQYLTFSCTCLVMAIAGSYVFALYDPIEAIASDDSLRTLTGRSEIWGATLKVWADNPWFGYGIDLFALDMTPDYLDFPVEARVRVTHAHNQFLQTLGEAGVVGVVGLLMYVGALGAYAVRYTRATRGVSLALLVVLLVRSISEPALGIGIGSGVFPHMILFAVLMLAAREAASSSARPASGQFRRTPALARS